MTAIILAGGKSSRMGTNKAFIEIGGMPLIKRQLKLLKQIFKKIVIVTNSLEKYKWVNTEKLILNADIRKSNADTRRFSRRDNLRTSACNLRESALKDASSRVTKLRGIKIIQDIIPHRGPLGGIYSGLVASNSTYNFVIACDMPFINQALIRYIIRNRDNYDIVIPKIDKKYHPLFGVYSKNCIPVIEKALSKDKLNVSTIFPKVKTAFISRQAIERFDKPLLSLVNINTQGDLAMLKVMKGAKTCQRQYFQR